MSDLPPQDALVTLLAVARQGSITAAADEMGLTHGAVSRRISALEQWLGSPLFERHGRGVRLTPVGAQFTRRVQRSLDAISSLARNIRSPGGHATVKVSTLPSLARLWIVPHLHAIEGAGQQFDLRIRTEHGVAELDPRQTDLAIRSGYGDWPAVRSIRLFGDNLVPVGTPALAQRCLEIGDIMRIPLLVDGPSEAWVKWSEGAGLRYAPKAPERRFEDYDLALSAAAAGVGAALARLPLAADFLQHSGLVPLSNEFVEIGRSHWLVMRQGEERDAVLAAAEAIAADAEILVRTGDEWARR